MNVIHLEMDGGAINNPGPAAAGVALKSESGEVLLQHGEFLGEATSNAAEYRALLMGLELLRGYLERNDVEPGEVTVEVQTDSRLLARQLRGEWETRDESLSALQEQIRSSLAAFDGWEIEDVPREQNRMADRIVNRILAGRTNGEEVDDDEEEPEDETQEDGPLPREGQMDSADFYLFGHGSGSQGDDPAGMAFLLRDGKNRDLLLKENRLSPASSALATYRAFETGLERLLQILNNRPSDDDNDSEVKPQPSEAAVQLHALNDLVVNQLTGNYSTNKEELRAARDRVRELVAKFDECRMNRDTGEELQDLRKRAGKVKQNDEEDNGDGDREGT